MGKKSRRRYLESGYDEEECKKIADQLEDYIDTVKTLVIINDKSKKKVKKSIKVIEKAIKDLREGRPEEVFNYDNYKEYESLKDDMFEDDY